MSEIKPFLCEVIDKAIIKSEWEKWYRSFSLYLAAEEIKDNVKRKNKRLHLGRLQLQEVAFNIPGALVELVEGKEVDVFEVLVNKLGQYFSPQRNSTFERHLFRSLRPEQGENLNKFMIRLRNQAAKFSFGETKKEILEICLKDKIIDSWAPNDLKKRLLEKEYSVAEITEMCQVYEQINQSEVMLPPERTWIFNVNHLSCRLYVYEAPIHPLGARIRLAIANNSLYIYLYPLIIYTKAELVLDPPLV